jgi:CRP/FNR family transcriptional regulator, cyclic AMP receptor protein
MRSVLSLCQGLPEKAFQRGDILMTEGGRDKLIYVLIEGGVDIYKRDILVSSQFEPGAIYGELAVLLDVPHTATVKAATNSRAYVVEEANDFLRSHPDMSFQLASLLARKLNSITSYLADLKHQFEDRDDHLGMVDEVLESLLHEQVEELEPGSVRYPDDTID